MPEFLFYQKNDKLKLLAAVRYVWWHKKGVPPIEQHPLQIRRRPVHLAQSQKNTATVELQNTNLIA